MTLKRSMLVLFVLLVVSMAALAQEATPEAMPEAVTSTELTETTSLGEIMIAHPAGWLVTDGNEGVIILSNVDLTAIADPSQYPANTLLAQVNFFSTAFIPDLNDESTPQDLLGLLPPPEGIEFEVETMMVNDVEIAGIDASNEEVDSSVYAYRVSEDTFALVIASATQTGVLVDIEPVLLDVLASVDFAITAEIPTTFAEQYASVQQGVSEEGFPQLGDPEAPVEIIEISSFDCPACANFHDNVFPQILERVQAGEVVFTYVPIFGTGGIPGGDVATQAALCAAQQDAFWAYHDGIFSWQQFGLRAFTTDRLVQAVRALDLDAAAWAECLTSEETTNVLRGAFDFARNEPSFTGTPTVLVNGENVPNSLQAVMSAIDEALAGEGETDTEATGDE